MIGDFLLPEECLSCSCTAVFSLISLKSRDFSAFFGADEMLFYYFTLFNKKCQG